MIEPTVSLSLTLESNPGTYACLLGSGVSATSGIPTGWGIIVDLVTRVALSLDDDPADDPAGWYRARYGEDPDYSKLLDEVARTPTERALLLRSYFEPTEEERRRGVKAPTPAHRALASLAKQGFVRVFLTTNFDRLLEQALHDQNVVPTVITNTSDLEGAAPLSTADVTLIKLNGDYVDTRIKNTPQELAHYEPAIDALLDRVLDEYGLIIAGWSGQWDTALIEAFERCKTHRFSTYWTGRSAPKGNAARIMARRRGHFIQVKGADEFFTVLATRLGVLEQQGAVGAAEARGSNLPNAVSSFVGRRHEIDELDRLLDDTRLLTLHGIGGAGKTRTAIELAQRRIDRHRDGVWLVELAPVGPERVEAEIAEALGVAPERLDSALKTRDALLVVDNCEHVQEEAARVIARLLRSAPRVRVLATSRALLGLTGETVYALGPLGLPASDRVSAAELGRSEAAQLFIDRAHDVDTRFVLTEANSKPIARIVRQLDGIPLALELAAARTRTMPLETIADRLDNVFKVLRKGHPGALPHQTTLRAVGDWSWDLLEGEERRLFERLSVFRGGFSLSAAEAIAEDDTLAAEDVLDVLAELIDKALVSYEAGAGGRYKLLEPARQYAALKLDERGETRRFEDAHAQWFLQAIREAAPHLRSDETMAWIDRLVPDMDNFRIAAERLLEHGNCLEAIEFASLGAWLWWYRRISADAVSWIERGRDKARDVPPLLDALSLFAAGFLGASADGEKALARFDRASELFAGLGMEDLSKEAQAFRVISYLTDGRISELEDLLADALDWLENRPDVWAYRLARVWRMMAAMNRLDIDAALLEAEEGLRRIEGSTDPNIVFTNLIEAASAYRAAGDLDRAYELTRRAVDVWKTSDVGGAAGGLHQLAADEWLRGDHEKALEHAMRARDFYAALSPPDLVWIVALVRGSMGIAIERARVLSEFEALFLLPPKVAALQLILGRLERFARVAGALGNGELMRNVRVAAERAKEELDRADRQDEAHPDAFPDAT
jgi:predicted ATPase